MQMVRFIKGTGSIMLKKDMEKQSFQEVKGNMKEIGKEIKDMATELQFCQVEPIIQENFQMENVMVKEKWSKRTVLAMRVSGLATKKKEKELWLKKSLSQVESDAKATL